MSDSTTPQDGKAMSPASAGSRGEPVAWGVFYGDGKLHSSWDSHAKAECTAVTMRRFDHLGVYVSPLYRSPTLTCEEREVLARVADDASYRAMEMTERVVRGLLERLK